MKTIEWHQEPLDYPAKGQPFSAELDSGTTRTVETILADHSFPTFNVIGEVTGTEIRQAPYSYVYEYSASSVNICFLQFGEDGPSAINYITKLATQVYNEKLGPANIGLSGRYIAPEQVNFYVYVPPTDFRESFTRVALGWQNADLKFANPEWNHQEKIPYVLRKLAAIEGLAKDPDAPELARGRRNRRVDRTRDP